MADYTEIFGDTQISAVQSTVTALLELIDDPRGRKNISNFIYQSDPRRKAADFGSYPIIYLENYELSNDDVNVGGNLFNKTLSIELHIISNDNSAKQKEWNDKLADDLSYKFDYSERQSLAEQGITQPEISRNQRFTGIDRDDQPIIRREMEIEAGVQIDMEQVGDVNPYE